MRHTTPLFCKSVKLMSAFQIASNVINVMVPDDRRKADMSDDGPRTRRPKCPTSYKKFSRSLGSPPPMSMSTVLNLEPLGRWHATISSSPLDNYIRGRPLISMPQNQNSWLVRCQGQVGYMIYLVHWHWQRHC